MAHKLAIAGAAGRMGRLLVAQAARSEPFEISGALDKAELLEAIAAQLARNQCQDVIPQASASQAFAGADIVIDFSAAEAVAVNAQAAAEASAAYLVGVTGLDAQGESALAAAAERVAVLHAKNVSTGMGLLTFLVRQAAAALDDSWDIEILEMHHRDKRDSPSGTALHLGQAAAAGRGLPDEAVEQAAQAGQRGVRQANTLGFAVLRGGTVAGEHSVIFAGEEERLVLSHQANARNIYATGALRLAAWLVAQPAGRYTTEEFFA